MNYYFYATIILGFEGELPQGFPLVDSFSKRNQGCFPLTSEQTTYYIANVNATILQVYYCGNVPQPIVPTIDPKEQREQAYATEPIIMWDGKLRTCDFCRALIVTYQLLQDTREAELRGLWLQGRNEIQNKYPENQ
jgi:hypothetical protein